MQITKYVEREIINHRCLVHPHIIQYKEVRTLRAAWISPARPRSFVPSLPPYRTFIPLTSSLCVLLCMQVFLTPNHLCIAMEFAPGGDMFEYVVRKNGLKEDEARWFFQQLIVGLDYCHRMVSWRLFL